MTFELFVFLLICYGITNIIVNSKLFEGVRIFFDNNWKFIGDLLNCTMCTGFWVGIFVAIVFNEMLFLDNLGMKNINVFFIYLFIASSSSVVSWFFDTIAEYLISNSTKINATANSYYIKEGLYTDEEIINLISSVDVGYSEEE